MTVEEMEQKKEEDEDDEWHVQLATAAQAAQRLLAETGGQPSASSSSPRRGEGKRGKIKDFLEAAPGLQLEFQQSQHEWEKVPQVQFFDRVLDIPVATQRCVPTVQTVQVVVSQVQSWVRLSTRPLLCYDWC